MEQPTVRTTGGNPGLGGACRFPFEFDGKNYTDCTCAGGMEQPWCSLEAMYTEFWGLCVGDFSHVDCSGQARAGSSDSAPRTSQANTVDVPAGTIVGILTAVVIVCAALAYIGKVAYRRRVKAKRSVGYNTTDSQFPPLPMIAFEAPGLGSQRPLYSLRAKPVEYKYESSF